MGPDLAPNWLLFHQIGRVLIVDSEVPLPMGEEFQINALLQRYQYIEYVLDGMSVEGVLSGS